jgi:hypothetical protein
MDCPYHTPPGPGGTVPFVDGAVTERNDLFSMTFLYLAKISGVFMYPWPIGNFDNAMDDALDIAMNYLMLTGHAGMFKEAQSTAARAIVTAWQGGVKHRIKLANAAIKAVEETLPVRA